MSDDVNDLMPRVIDSTCWKDLALDECKERIAELEAQLDGLASWFMGHGFSAQEVRKWVDEHSGD